MRDSLKNLFEAEITIEDKSSYYYSVKPFELTNMLGNIAAILQEYNFTKKADNTNPICVKLYKTKEGNWYDLEDAPSKDEKGILRMLKSAIDMVENNCVFVDTSS
ncbi:MAG: hypothetical protein ABI091_31300 [Ferruginibacter sp.]